MFLDHPTMTATASQSEPERIERRRRAQGDALGLADPADCGRGAALHGTTCFAHEA